MCRIAYIEFVNKESGLKAKHLNESLFRGRQLTVEAKRKNIPRRGAAAIRGGGRGNPMAMMMQIMRGFYGGRGGYRGRGGRGMPMGGPRGGRGGAQQGSESGGN